MVERTRKDEDSLFDSARSAATEDAGLREYLERVYVLMGGGLALTGVVAFLAVATGLYLALVTTPFFWVIVLAPLVLVFLLSFRIQRISLGAARCSAMILLGLL